MSPVLLDHRLLKILWLGVALLAVLTFLGGYMLGFEKSNNNWMTTLRPLPLTLPQTREIELALLEQRPPKVIAPGATIDVDRADQADDAAADTDSPGMADDGEAVAIAIIKAAVAKPAAVKADSANVQTTSADAQPPAPAFIGPVVSTTLNLAENNTAASAGSEPAQSTATAEALPAQNSALLTVSDDATEATALYSIQVGMYKSPANAAGRVEQMQAKNLSAYLQEYKNDNDELRYNVRFGYFSSFAVASQALKMFEQDFSGSGYVVRIRR